MDQGTFIRQNKSKWTNHMYTAYNRQYNISATRIAETAETGLGLSDFSVAPNYEGLNTPL